MAATASGGADAEVTPTATGKRARQIVLPPGARIGRYRVIERIGAGGMGVVYRAHDTELERDMAIKLVATQADVEGSSGRARLLREAQALAQLSHPNVIAIYDVGRHEGSLFVAMELVQGPSLAQWMRIRRRSWREVVAVFLAAGRGLEAAHAAGLVHRDFKPANVMVGTDGRVRVLDFGLARVVGGEPRAAASREVVAATASTDVTAETEATGAVEATAATDAIEAMAEYAAPEPTAAMKAIAGPDASAATGDAVSSGGVTHPSSAGLLSSPVTQLGAIVGTPTYMAPEQHAGQVGDAQSDQFSFCVSLYQALYGERPFEGPSRDELLVNIHAGRIRPAPPAARVPGWIRQIVVRGLAAEPDARWPSMGALLDALARDPARRRLRVGAAVGVAALAVTAAFGVWRATHGPAPCLASDARLAGVWDAARKEAVRAAFLATGKPYADAAFRAVERALDGYAGAWVAMQADACAATRVRAVQSEELLDLRMECLGRRLDEVRAQVDVFAGADATVVERAPQAVQALTPLAECADATALRAPVRPPSDAATRARVEAVRADLAVVRALLESGRYPEALGRAREDATAAQRLGYRPLEAEALLYLGRLQEVTGAYADAEQTLRAAGVAAEAGRQDHLAARAWAKLVLVVGSRLGRFADAHELAKEAQGKIERVGSDDLLLAELFTVIGAIHTDEGKYDEALADLRRAVAIRAQHLAADDPALAAARRELGDVYAHLGRYDDALDSYRAAAAAEEQRLGPDHPALAATLGNLATALRAKGQYDEALAQYERARAIGERSLGPEHPTLASVHVNVGTILVAQGKLDDALRHFRAARAIWARALGDDHANVGTVHFRVGTVLMQQGRPAEARVEFQRTLAIWEQALGRDHPSLAVAISGIADALLAQGAARDARVEYRRAVALLEHGVGHDHPELAGPLTGEGLAALATGEPRQALPLLERALALGAANPGEPLALARTQFGLARALRIVGREDARSVELATAARAAYAVDGARPRETAEIDRWLAQRR